MLEYINQLRARRYSLKTRVEGGSEIAAIIDDAGGNAGPAAARFARDWVGLQRPFAIVIVGGLIAALIMSVFLLPTLYVWLRRP